MLTDRTPREPRSADIAEPGIRAENPWINGIWRTTSPPSLTTARSGPFPAFARSCTMMETVGFAAAEEPAAALSGATTATAATAALTPHCHPC